jgi:hypothetical protein
MWTFTKRGKFASSDEVWAAWKLFRQLMARRFKKQKFEFVAVPELHSDGETWHLHVLFGRLYMVEMLRAFWYRSLGGTGKERGDQTPGSVNVKSLRARHSSGRGAARYIAGYVGKGFERGGANKRVFSASVGLAPVDVKRWRDPFDETIIGFADSVGRWLRDHFAFQPFFPRFLFKPGFEVGVIDAVFL